MIVLDTNYILRFLLNDNDDDDMHAQAKTIISQQPCLILNEAMAEVVYVLEGVYKMPKPVISQALSQLISLDNLSMHESKLVLIEALKFYEYKNMDFVDCYLGALREKYSVKSFNKKLQKCIKAKLK